MSGWGFTFPNKDNLNQILNNNHIARFRLAQNVWLSMPKDIWRLIFKRLFSHSDKMMFRATCRLFAKWVTYDGYKPFVYMDDLPTVDSYIRRMPFRKPRSIKMPIFENAHKSPNKPMKVPPQVTFTGPTHPEVSIINSAPVKRSHNHKKSHGWKEQRIDDHAECTGDDPCSQCHFEYCKKCGLVEENCECLFDYYYYDDYDSYYYSDYYDDSY